MIRLPYPTILAPMAGYTHVYQRRLIRSLGGAGLVVGEFISCEALSRGIPLSVRRLEIHPDEKPVSIQLFGTDPERMAESAVMAVDSGADIIDINAGCPARRILRSGSGAALLKDLGRLEEILQAVTGAVSVPVTIKTRLGFHSEDSTYLKVAALAEKTGVEAIALHPRTAEQEYRGKADWNQIANLKREASIPVWGNGDITSSDDALRMLETTGCDAVMVGRGLLRDPWLLKKISAALSGESIDEVNPQGRLQIMAQFLEEVNCPLTKALPLLIQAAYSFPGSREIRKALSAALLKRSEEPLTEILKIVLES